MRPPCSIISRNPNLEQSHVLEVYKFPPQILPELIRNSICNVSNEIMSQASICITLNIRIVKKALCNYFLKE
jgi:predicted restriction endonuclease